MFSKTPLNQNGKLFLSQTVTVLDQDERVRDAIWTIKNAIQSKAKYVLDADIAKCFDRINHWSLLQRLNMRGKVRRQIKAWLKSGVIDQKVFTAISEGTPQGGVSALRSVLR